jgi:hypothetical protein
VWDADDEEILVGYSDDDSDDPELVEGVIARFETGLVRVSSDEDHIRDHCLDIRKIVRRAVINPEVASHKAFLDSAFEVAGLPVNNRLKADINFQYEFKTRLTPEKLSGVIANYEENETESWNDVGFVFAREGQKIHWLSGAIAREKFQIDVDRADGGMIDVESLANYMTEHFSRIVDSFDE